MKVTAERIPDSQVLLNIEIDPERVESSIDQAYRRIAPRARIPGFRPGKAPRAIVERHVGRDALLHEALDRLVPLVVQEAIESESLDVVDRPDLEISSLDPVIVKATVPVRPTVELGDYRALRVGRDPIEVDPEKVAEALEQLRVRFATVEPVDRPVQDGDVIRLDIRATSGDRSLIEQEDAELTVAEDQLKGLPGIHPQLIGLAAGEEQTFEVTAPDDAPGDLAGQPIEYTVTIKDVKSQTLPELDDEFAKEVGENFPTLAALRARIESDQRARLDAEADHKLEDAALEQLAEQATVEFPPQLVEREVERMLRDQGVPGEDRKTFERFLQRAGLNEDQLRQEFRPAAAGRVKRSLVLSQLREQEGIAITPEEVETELAGMIGATAQSEQLRQIFDTESGREVVERNLLSRRTLERLRQIVLGEAPPLPEPSEAPAEAEAAADEVVATEGAATDE